MIGYIGFFVALTALVAGIWDYVRLKKDIDFLMTKSMALAFRVEDLEYQIADFRRRPREPLTDGRTLARFNLDMLRRGLGQ